MTNYPPWRPRSQLPGLDVGGKTEEPVPGESNSHLVVVEGSSGLCSSVPAGRAGEHSTVPMQACPGGVRKNPFLRA